MEKEIYHAYLAQDYYYLMDYTKALLKLSDQAISPDEKLFFAECAEGCLQEPAFEIKDSIAKNASQKTNACANYLNFLHRHSAENYQNSLASVFPCFYVYYYVAKKLYPKNKDNVYIDWFDIYTSQLFENQNQIILAILQKEYDSSDEKQKNNMIEIIKEGAWHEWHFWDAFYQ